ncbi:NAD(P)-dependent oxidoreductase [Amycolatopsis sp. FDAARGOS 1241]|uniref:NAD-dependent epimerase/dehydratase family protein n=1 Tax=Amycolatopsis sp. FDAARGOS 1241 TaxID=2778070 RepID=UPI0019501B9E|nr:NAD-dependent epimerase/dehydratase family protein [Amycolatopsis sp. FDAARGOS 1241]QRP47290.1 NAD(P)H-binding protein [Amycolatopsis sp. FDAARGOS 1241]
MRVMVIGSTGVLGIPAVRRLLADGHDVSGLARDESRVAAVRATGAKPVLGDVFDVESLTAALRGHDAVLNLATRIPDAKHAARKSGWADNDRLRTEGARTLAAAVRAVDELAIVVQEGVSLVYADGGDAELTEDAPLDPRFPATSSLEAHAAVAGLEAEGRTAVRLRIGTLISADPMTTALLTAARRGSPLIMGSRDAWTTAIHPTDAAAAAVAALRAPSAVYNVGATPVRKRQLGAALAVAAGVSRPRALPRWAARLFGPTEVLSRSHRVVSDRLTGATGWRPEKPVPGPDWF